MPLTKRLQYELCDQWREQALRYKDLQREAEDLVGSDRTSDDFEHHVIAGLEQASVFYEAKVQELQGVVDEVMLSVQSVVEVHDMHERATSFSRAQSVDVEGPSQEGAEMREKVTSFLRAQSCPEEMSRFLAGAGDDSGEDEGAARHARGRGMSAGAADEDELAAVIRDALAAIAATDAAPGQDDEDGSEREGEGEAEKRQSEGRSPRDARDAARKCFRTWRLAAPVRKPRRASLAHFFDDTFLLRLEESALQDALRELLPMLVYIDRIRNFALLNCVAAVKLAKCHCEAKSEERLMAALRALPMFSMRGLSTLGAQIEQQARSLYRKLSVRQHQDSNMLPSSWSLHLCTFCSHTAENPVVLSVGRMGCWACAMASAATGAIIYCPLTHTPISIKELRVVSILATFLRRFFPKLKGAPACLGVGTYSWDAKCAARIVPAIAPSMGMLAARRHTFSKVPSIIVPLHMSCAGY